MSKLRPHQLLSLIYDDDESGVISDDEPDVDVEVNSVVR